MPKGKTSKTPKKGSKKPQDSKKKEKADPKKWSTKTVKADVKRRDSIIGDDILNTIVNEIPTMTYISATELSKKYNIRVSSAKNLLKDLEDKKVINLYMGSRNLKIYSAK